MASSSDQQDHSNALRDRSKEGRAVLFMQAAIEYGPFIIVAALLIATTLANEVPRLADILPPSRVGLYVCIAFVALLAFVLRLTDRVRHLTETVEKSVKVQEEFIASAVQAATCVSLGQAFRIAEEAVGRCERIRVYAITSKFVSQHMQPREFSTQGMHLLVGGGDIAAVAADPLLDSEVHISVLYTWVGRVRSGAIDELTVRQYDFFPTEWFVVFDDRLMIMNNYVYDQHSVGLARTPSEAYLIRADNEGKKLIRSKTEAFDALFDAAQRNFGTGRYEGVYRLLEKRVKKQSAGSDAWDDLDPISEPILLPREG